MNAPDLAWQASDLGVGQGGLITITATLSDDVALLGTTITSSGALYLPAVANNSATVSAARVALRRQLFLPAVVR